jgi:hypothetical protein
LLPVDERPLLAERLDATAVLLDTAILEITIAVALERIEAVLHWGLISAMTAAMATDAFAMREADGPRTTTNPFESAGASPCSREVGAQATAIASQTGSIVCPITRRAESLATMVELHTDRTDGVAHRVAILAAEIVGRIAFRAQRQAHAAAVDAMLVRAAALR